MIGTEVFIETILLENFTQNTFGDVKFFSKVHISRENPEKMVLGARFDSPPKRGNELGAVGSCGNTLGHA